MKLYLSSIDIPAPAELEILMGKPLKGSNVALIPNAQDYYSLRAWDYKVGKRSEYFESFGLHCTVVDLREVNGDTQIYSAFKGQDLIWAMGGNTFCLRYEMRKSGFDHAIRKLLSNDTVYGGDSAGALVAGTSISGIESADIPQFAVEKIDEGLGLVPFVVLLHIDNPEF